MENKIVSGLKAAVADAKVASPPRISVDADMFNAALAFKSNEETRYYLNGVHVAPHPVKGALVVATDGRRLVVIHDEAGVCSKSAIIPADKPMLRALSEKPKQPGTKRVQVDDAGVVTIAGHYQSAGPCLIDGTYPDWPAVLRPVLKGEKSRLPIVVGAFNPGLLGSLALIRQRLGSPDGGVRIFQRGEEGSPALILFAGLPHVFAVIMPMRADTGVGFPAWMKPVMEPPKPPAAVEVKEPAARTKTVRPAAKAKPKPGKKAKPAIKGRARRK